jgi:hypothetical protein
MVIKLNYSKGEFVDGKDYDYDVITLGTQATRLVHNWVTDVGKKLSEIVGEDDPDLEIVGDMTFGEMKDKLKTIFMKGMAWTDEEVALYKIDEKIRESRILTNKVIIDQPTYIPLEWFEGYDCKLTYEGKTYQAWAVQYFGGCDLGKADLYILWVIPEPEVEDEGLAPEKKKKGIFKRGE